MKSDSLWKQLKRFSIPIFNGEKQHYENWTSPFTSCVDQKSATPESKLLQLQLKD